MEDSGGAGHRVLVFAQLKGLLDIVEQDVMRPAGISYLRLDGSVRTSKTQQKSHPYPTFKWFLE